jgi:hypothetical protein
VGGYSYNTTPGTGGKVGTNDFFGSNWGYVILQHTNSFFSSNQPNLEEALCHEIGHALGLGHSAFTSAIMYPVLQGNRGATLGGDDVSRILAEYPSNTPPYTLNRYMNIMTRSSAQLTPQPGANATWLPLYDLQGTNGLTIVSTSGTGNNGTFSLTGSLLSYTPGGLFSGSVDPGSGAYYDAFTFRVSDGTNLSPIQSVNVVSYLPDTSPADGLPDSWESLYPTMTGGANGDSDGDGISNQQEWMCGTNPTQKTSRLAITMMTGLTNLTWNAKPYELYEVQSTNRLGAGFSLYKPAVPTNTTGSVTIDPSSAGTMFFRVQHIP